MITETEAKAHVAANVKRLMEEQGVSQAELARRLKTHEMAVSRLVRGTNEPSVTFLANVSEALGVTVDTLLAEPPRKNSRRAS